MKSILFYLVILFSFLSGLIAQDDRQALFPISNDGRTFTGEGINWIFDRADSVKFIMFGEQHGVEGIAQFVTFTYKNLQERDFNFLVLETDGWTTQRSADIGVIPFTRKNPHSIAFDSDGDLELMQAAIDSNPDITTPVWGVDQMQTAIHPYFRLTEIANSAKQKRLARGAFLKASLKMGRYTREDHLKDIEILEKVFSNISSEEKSQIFRELRLTIEIFSKWMNPATRQESVSIREQLMGQNFDRYLDKYPDAKAIFKMGGAHTLYGIGPNNVPTFGEHVSNSTNNSTLSIAIYRYNEERSLVSESDFRGSNMLLLDTRAAVNLYPEDSARLVQNDAIIYLRDAANASKSINWPFEMAFKNNLIARIIPLGIGLIICLVMLLTSLVLVLVNKKYRNRRMVTGGLGSLMLLSCVGYQIIQILKFPTYSATIDEGVFPILIYILFGTLSIVYCFFSFQLIRNKSKSTVGKIGYAIFAIGYCLSSYLIYYWNLVGMLD